MATIESLKRQGWHLTKEGVELCSKGIANISVEEVIKEALNADLKTIGEKCLPDGLSKVKTEAIEGTHIVQLSKVKNVSVPRESDAATNDVSFGGRLLRLAVTDGHITYPAIDIDNIVGLSVETPPGTKLKLTGKVSVSQGFLILSKSNCKVLGGHVDKLVEQWQLKRSLVQQAKEGSSTTDRPGGPPKFIPFGQKRTEADAANDGKKGNFKSLDASGGSGGKKKESDVEFDKQRNSLIAAAINEARTGIKSPIQPFINRQNTTRNPDKDVAQIVEMGFSAERAQGALRDSHGNVEQAVAKLLGEDQRSGGVQKKVEPTAVVNSAESRSDDRGRRGGEERGGVRGEEGYRGGGRGGGRRGGGRRNEEEDDYTAHARPSAPATLFDFVTSKIPASASDDKKSSSTTKPSKPEESNRLSSSAAEPATSSDTTAASSAAPAQNLPPRLQRKQDQPRGAGGGGNLWSSGGGEGANKGDKPINKQYDVNTRGSVNNKNLWTDNNTAASDNRNSNTYRNNSGTVRSQGNESGRYNNEARSYSQRSDRGQGESNGRVRGLENQMNNLNVRDNKENRNQKSRPLLDTPNTSNAQQDLTSISSSRDDIRDKEKNNGVLWKAGDFCLAKYWQDKEFYRAQIVVVNPAGTYAKVNFVDYGNHEDVSMNDIKPLPERDAQQQNRSQASQQPTTQSWQQQQPQYSAGSAPHPSQGQMLAPQSSAGQGVVYQQGAATQQGASIVLCAIPSGPTAPGLPLQPNAMLPQAQMYGDVQQQFTQPHVMEYPYQQQQLQQGTVNRTMVFHQTKRYPQQNKSGYNSGSANHRQ